MNGNAVFRLVDASVGEVRVDVVVDDRWVWDADDVDTRVEGKMVHVDGGSCI